MALVAGGLYVFARLSGMLVAMPVLGAAGVPVWARLLFAVPVVFLLLPVASAAEVPLTLSALLGGVVLELALGLLVGLIMQVAYAALGIAAEIISVQTGLAMAALLDPVSSTQAGAVGVLLTWLGAGVFLGAGVHRHMLAVVAESFATVPPGSLEGLGEAGVLVPLAGTMLATGVQLAGPVTLFVLAINVGISVLGRMAPGQQLFFAIGTTLQTVIGLALLGVALPMVLRVWMAEVDGAFEAAIRVLAGGG